MRICCLFLFAGILLIRPVFAQSVSIGLRGGLGQACHQRYFDRDYDRSFPLKPVVAAVLGANITVGLDAHLALEVGLQYEGKGNIRYAVKSQYHYVSPI